MQSYLDASMLTPRFLGMGSENFAYFVHDFHYGWTGKVTPPVRITWLAHQESERQALQCLWHKTEVDVLCNLMGKYVG